MKKRVLIISLTILSLLILNSLIISAQSEPQIAGQEDYEKIKETTDKIPIDPETGGFDPSKLNESKSKAEQRIDKINEYVGPITKLILGVELSLSWIFIYAVLLWIILAEILIEPIKAIFHRGNLFAIIISLMISSIAMQGFGKNLVAWLDSIITQWYLSLALVLVAIIAQIIYQIIMKKAGSSIDKAKENAAKEQTLRDRQLIHTDAEVSKANLESYKDK